MNYNIVVTGADGYIGRNFCEYIQSYGHNVIKYTWEIGDFDIQQSFGTRTNHHVLKCNNPTHEYRGKIDFVVHLAALTGVRRSLENKEEYWRTNVLGTRLVFAKCQQHNIRLLFASSSNALEVTNPYAETKYQNELDRTFNSVGFRPHTVYPGRDDMLFQSLLRGDVKYINGDHYRDFTHINDMCSALHSIMLNFDALRGQVVDIGSGRSVSVYEVAKAMGFDGEVRHSDTPNERKKTHANINTLVDLGWMPREDIFDEIEKRGKQ